MINRNLKYVDAYMIYEDLSKIPDYKLPEGFSFRGFKNGDQKHWVDIEVSSGDIVDEQTGFEKFDDYYGKYLKDLEDRFVFVVDSDGTPVATVCGWYMQKPINDVITGDLHWLAVKKEYQGLGLSKPLIVESMKIMYKYGHKGAFCHSQTHTWLACKIYLSLGWKKYRPKNQSIEEFNECWDIINSQ